MDERLRQARLLYERAVFGGLRQAGGRIRHAQHRRGAPDRTKKSASTIQVSIKTCCASAGSSCWPRILVTRDSPASRARTSTPYADLPIGPGQAEGRTDLADMAAFVTPNYPTGARPRTAIWHGAWLEVQITLGDRAGRRPAREIRRSARLTAHRRSSATAHRTVICALTSSAYA
jgi:hypothetical protein